MLRFCAESWTFCRICTFVLKLCKPLHSKNLATRCDFACFFAHFAA